MENGAAVHAVADESEELGGQQAWIGPCSTTSWEPGR